MQAAINHERLVDAIGDAIVISNADGHITRWNLPAERIFGFTREEALGNPLDMIIRERRAAGTGTRLSQDDGERADALQQRSPARARDS